MSSKLSVEMVHHIEDKKLAIHCESEGVKATLPWIRDKGWGLPGGKTVRCPIEAKKMAIKIHAIMMECRK